MKNPESLRREFTELCTACGLCADMCPPFSHRSVPGTGQEIQQQIRSYLGSDPPTNAVIERSRLCNECYLCVTDTCPQGLNPMRTNQLLRGLLHKQEVDPRPFVPPSAPQSFERIATALLTTEEEYRRITTPVVKGDGRLLFFPGCNIYYQPNLLLTAMDVLDMITDDWTFLPGLSHCCGSNWDSAGRLDGGLDVLEELASAMGKTGYETVVVWCSTCSVRLNRAGFDIPVVSFARLVADRLARLPDKKNLDGRVTLQEPCKDAYLGLDSEAPREVLRQLSGEPVREMARHGRNTVCCGWALRLHEPEAWNEHHERRLAEARAAGAETMATVCHGCQWIMDKPRAGTGMRVINYLSLAGEAMGISHPERFRKLRQKGSPEAAIDYLRREMGDRFEKLPFDRDRILETVEILMEGFYGT